MAEDATADRGADHGRAIGSAGHTPGHVAGRPRGCRPRSLDGITDVLGALAARVAESPALNATRTAGTVWLAPAREHQWQHQPASALLTGLNPEPNKHLPARGVDPGLGTEVLKTAVSLGPALLPMAGRLLGGGRRTGRAARVPLVTEPELTSMWLATLLGALCEHGRSGRLRLADLGSAARRAAAGDHILLCDVAMTAVLWLPRRRLIGRRRSTAIAHWSLVTAEGCVVGAGVVTDR